MPQRDSCDRPPFLSSFLSVPGPPFGLVYARKNIAFVTLGNSIGILDTSKIKPTLTRKFPLPRNGRPQGNAFGFAITGDKRHLYVARGCGAVIIDVAKAIAGHKNPVIGRLCGNAGTSAIKVTLAAGEGYAFVSQEYGAGITHGRGAIEVFKLTRKPGGLVSSTYVGFAELGYAVVGSALSPDGQVLYVTSELRSNTTPQNKTPGWVSVLDVATLKTNPSHALRFRVEAGCQPVRVAPSKDGRYVWVTARGSNKLLAFDAEKLRSKSPDALLASVQLGTSPVSSILVKGGRYIITSDSNRFGYAGATTGLTVVDVKAALNGKQGFPRIPTGSFPREFAVSPDGNTLLVGQYGSKTIQAIDIGHLGD
ncbi:ribosomal protein [Hirsutella rhossiliensis]|uniref:37s ribosomal protein rsm22 protein n=1 Tax=Hirsutella rhossiliensis TaxID=111463 RepID=A0A9P8SGP4_9HYPO|nr:putative 37s ribosomal protein rsm22 protein [Hirsutella rhossiliensis]KAH0962283.1 putative 37s ribosomal protein rsm22 protein [Hirsutella rhossiliensis]